MKTLNKTLAFAHRGYHAQAVENSLAAIQAAYEAGCDGVEFDVQLTRDGVPVLFHDDDLQRLAGKSQNLYDLAWPQLRQLGLAQNGARCTIPTLEAFLSRWCERPFYLELKVPAAKQNDLAYQDGLAQACLRLLAQAPLHPQTFLASFNLGMMRNLCAAKAFSRLGVIYEDEAALVSVLQDPTFESSLCVHSLEFALYTRRSNGGLSLPHRDKLWVWGLHTDADLQKAYADGLGGIVADDVPAMLRIGLESTGSR